MPSYPVPQTATPDLTVKGERFWCDSCSRYRPKSQMHEQIRKYEWQILMECKECQQSRGHANRTAVIIAGRMKSAAQR